MKITILGSGSVTGAPVYGCDCIACDRARKYPEYKRKPASVLLESEGERLLVDAGSFDIGERFPPGQLSHILLTHYHMDHVQGLFSLRWGRNVKIKVIGPDDKNGCDDLFKHPGILDFSQKSFPYADFDIGPFHITPLPMRHSKLTLGYLFHSKSCLKEGNASFAYITDTCGLDKPVIDFLSSKPIDYALIDCTFPPAKSPRNHNDWTIAQEISTFINAKNTAFTHIGHALDEWILAESTPEEFKSLLVKDGECIVL